MRKIVVGVLMSLVLMVALAGAAFAATPTVTNVTWTGATGSIVGVVETGATTTTFNVNAGLASGNFVATDSNDNPYSYGVDTNSAYINGVVSGGSMSFQTVRNTSYVPMYGDAGQTVYAFVGSTGTGAMATGSGTNYAGMTNGTYGQPHTAGGYNFEASGSSYQILNYVTTSSGDYARFNALGNGSAVINNMTTGASGATNVNFGWGGGCYTNANATFTGAGSFAVDAGGTNGITTPISGASGAMVAGGWTASGVSTLSTIMNFTNGGSVGNYSVKVN